MTKTKIAGKSSKYLGIAVLVAICMAAWMGRSNGQQGSASVTVKADEIGGVVSSSKGPEAGVWVIAETTDLPTRYIKEVVTDDRGRYLIPGAAQSELHGLGARLRPGGFAEGADRYRQVGRPEADHRAGREDRCEVVSRQLLVRADEGAGEE